MLRFGGFLVWELAMKRLYKWIAMAGMVGGLVLPATVTCNVPDFDVRFVPAYDDGYYEDVYYEDYYYEDYYDDGFDFGFDFWNW
jgi:hypothetical protein